LLTRDAVKHLLDELRTTSPAAVDELIPGVMKLGEVQRVLQTLLREQVPIRQLQAILETLGDYAAHDKDPILLAERVRQRLGRAICNRHRDPSGRLHVVTLDPALEERIRINTELGDDGLHIRLSPGEVKEICAAIEREAKKLVAAGRLPIVLTSPSIRPALKQLTAPHLPQLVVLGYSEIARDTKIESIGMVADIADGGQLAVGSYRKSA
jgi:flagellar biosynthesis protein FlhA